MTQSLQDAADKYHNSFKLEYRRDDNSLSSSGIEEKHAHYNNEALPTRKKVSVAPPQKSHVTEDRSPCGTSVQRDINVCKQKHVDGITVCHAETKAGAKDWHDDCLVCVWYARHVVGSSKGPCDRKKPCNNCLALSEARYCRYQRTG